MLACTRASAPRRRPSSVCEVGSHAHLMRKALETIRENGGRAVLSPGRSNDARLVLSELGVSYSGS